MTSYKNSHFMRHTAAIPDTSWYLFIAIADTAETTATKIIIAAIVETPIRLF
jgi:hypothetical protein